VAERRPFLLRMDPEVYAALQRWAADDLRSLNAQIEFVLRRALREEGRLRGDDPAVAPEGPPAVGDGAPGATGLQAPGPTAVPPAPDAPDDEGGG